MAVTIHAIAFNNVGAGMLVTFSSSLGVLSGDYWQGAVVDTVTGDELTRGEQLRNDPTDVLLGWSFANHSFSGLYIPRAMAQNTQSGLALQATLFDSGGTLRDFGQQTGMVWQSAGYMASLSPAQALTLLDQVLASVRKNY